VTRKGLRHPSTFVAKLRDLFTNSVVLVRYPSLLGTGSTRVRRVTKSVSMMTKSKDEDGRVLRAPPSLTFAQLFEAYSSSVITGELKVVFLGR
jgi:hypothetical protein